MTVHHDGHSRANDSSSSSSLRFIQSGSIGPRSIGSRSIGSGSGEGGASEVPGAEYWATQSLHTESFETISFSFEPHDLRAGEGCTERPVERRSWSRDAYFFRALELEKATKRIERPVGIKGEGPALSLNSTNLRTLIVDNFEMALGLLERYSPVYTTAKGSPLRP